MRIVVHDWEDSSAGSERHVTVDIFNIANIYVWPNGDWQVMIGVEGSLLQVSSGNCYDISEAKIESMKTLKRVFGDIHRAIEVHI